MKFYVEVMFYVEIEADSQKKAEDVASYLCLEDTAKVSDLGSDLVSIIEVGE